MLLVTTKEKKMTERYLRLPEVHTRTGLSRSYIYALMKEGTFPRPVRLGKRAVGWLESDLDEWMAAKYDEMIARSKACEAAFFEAQAKYYPI